MQIAVRLIHLLNKKKNPIMIEVLTENMETLTPIQMDVKSVKKWGPDVQAIFDLGPLEKKPVNFDDLVKELITRYDENGKRKILDTLSNAHSFTIKGLQAMLEMDRMGVCILIGRLVHYGAYAKYFSYWKRTALFTEWCYHACRKTS